MRKPRWNQASDIEIAYDDLKALKSDEVQIALGQAATNADLGESYFKQWTGSLGQAVEREPQVSTTAPPH